MNLNKSLLAAAAIGVASMSAQADVLGARAGVDYFRAQTDGSVNSVSESWQDENRYSLFVAVEHPVPVLPNVMLRYNAAETQAGETELDLTNTELAFYYELLDNPAGELDLGLAYRQYGGELTSTEDIDFDEGLPMAYGRARLNVIGTGVFAFLDGVFTGYDGDTISDLRAGVGYSLGLVALDLNLTAGFRQHEFDVDGFDSLDANVTQDGWFVGVEIDI